MADIKISELGAASAVNSTDIFPMTSSGVTVKVTAQQLKKFMGVGNLADLTTDNKTSHVAAINEVDRHADTAQSTADAAQQMIAPIQSNLIASNAYTVGEQFVYNGLLYKVTAAIAQGGTITINGNCALADNVTEQIKNIPKIRHKNLGSITINANSVEPIITDISTLYPLIQVVQTSYATSDMADLIITFSASTKWIILIKNMAGHNVTVSLTVWYYV